MSNVLINCPHTGRPVFTGVKLPDALLKSSNVELGTHRFHCPCCGEAHEWSKADAYLAPETQAVAQGQPGLSTYHRIR